jgi:hypothetical protein
LGTMRKLRSQRPRSSSARLSPSAVCCAGVIVVYRPVRAEVRAGAAEVGAVPGLRGAPCA